MGAGSTVLLALLFCFTLTLYTTRRRYGSLHIKRVMNLVDILLPSSERALICVLAAIV